jgi:molybdenum cofactor biosynthesis enzyme MoaA
MLEALMPAAVRLALKHGIVGRVDRVEGSDTLVGWAADLSSPGRRLVVECVHEGRSVGSTVAADPRPDLAAQGIGDGAHGFRFSPPADAFSGEAVVSVRVQGTGHILHPRQLKLRTDLSIWFVAADIVNNCNLRCPFCVVDYSQISKTQVMQEETFRKLMQLLPVVPAGQFYISCLHEPTLHPRLNQFLELIPEAGRHKVFFTTNLARPLKRADFEAWARSGLHHINVSLDTLDAARFAYLRKHGRFEVFSANLDLMADVFRRAPGAPPLRYITMAFKSNLHEIEEIVRVSRERWLSTRNEIRYTFNVAHITDDFRRQEYLAREDWAPLTARLKSLGVPVEIQHPPAGGYEEVIAPQNFFDAVSRPGFAPRVTFTKPLGLRVSSDGTVVVSDAEDALRVKIESLEDPPAFFRALHRQARMRDDGAYLVP